MRMARRCGLVLEDELVGELEEALDPMGRLGLEEW